MRSSEPRTPWLQGRRPVACIASRNTLRMDLAQDLEAVIQPSIRPASCRRSRAASATYEERVAQLAEAVRDGAHLGPCDGDQQPIERSVDLSPHLSAGPAGCRPRAPRTGSLESEVSPRRPSNTGERSRH